MKFSLHRDQKKLENQVKAKKEWDNVEAGNGDKFNLNLMIFDFILHIIIS